MRYLSPLAAAAAILSAGPAFADHHEEGEQAKAPDIRGAYEIVSGEKYGEAIPASELADNRVVITADTFAVVDRDSKQLYANTYKLKPTRGKGKKADDAATDSSEEKPAGKKMGANSSSWLADFVSTIPKEGVKAPGKVRVRTKTGKDGKPEVAGLVVIYSLSDERPKTFKTGAKDLMFKLKKTAEKAGDGGDKKPGKKKKPADDAE